LTRTRMTESRMMASRMTESRMMASRMTDSRMMASRMMASKGSESKADLAVAAATWLEPSRSCPQHANHGVNQSVARMTVLTGIGTIT
jgi:hypothetical protein